MLRFDVGEDLLHYYCNVDRVTVYATAPVNVAVGARILRQIAAGARDGGQEPRAGSIELAEAGLSRSNRRDRRGTLYPTCRRYSKRRAEKRGAFRLHIAVRPPSSSRPIPPPLPAPGSQSRSPVACASHRRLAAGRDTVRYPLTDETTNAAISTRTGSNCKKPVRRWPICSASRRCPKARTLGTCVSPDRPPGRRSDPAGRRMRAGPD
jgi:hypothetical protein